MRIKIALACATCQQRNYRTTKSKLKHPEKMVANKFCPFCSKHTQHVETK